MALIKTITTMDEVTLLAETLQPIIDHAIKCDLMEQLGWYTVRVERDLTDELELEQWLKQNIKNSFLGIPSSPRWMFEDEKDANWFILRWSS